MLPSTDSREPPSDLRRQRLETVVREYQQPLLRYAARLLRNSTLAQDVVQNVFVKLFRQWPPHREADESLKPWLFRVTHNEAVDLIRGEERRRGLHAREAADPATMLASVQPAPIPDERAALVLACLERLDPGERQVILLRLQQGLSYDEIAVATGKPRGTVGALLHTAVKKLAQHVRRKEAV